jgi:hypothetical protein
MNDLKPIREIEQNVMEILGVGQPVELAARG